MDYESFSLVAYFENEDSEIVVGFSVASWVENVSYGENHLKLVDIDVESFDEEYELSFKNVLTFHKKIKVNVERRFISFEYKGFWVESENFDQAENGHAEDGITFTSYVWHSKEERDALEDEIEILREVFDSPEELEIETKKKIDKYIKNQKKEKK